MILHKKHRHRNGERDIFSFIIKTSSCTTKILKSTPNAKTNVAMLSQKTEENTMVMLIASKALFLNVILRSENNHQFKPQSQASQTG